MKRVERDEWDENGFNWMKGMKNIQVTSLIARHTNCFRVHLSTRMKFILKILITT